MTSSFWGDYSQYWIVWMLLYFTTRWPKEDSIKPWSSGGQAHTILLEDPWENHSITYNVPKSGCAGQVGPVDMPVCVSESFHHRVWRHGSQWLYLFCTRRSQPPTGSLVGWVVGMDNTRPHGSFPSCFVFKYMLRLEGVKICLREKEREEKYLNT